MRLPEKKDDPAYLDELITQEAAAEFLSTSPRFLEKRRSNGDGPQFIRISHRCIRYRRKDLIEWANSLAKTSTSAA
jgi:hypothetical protein